MKAKFLVAGLLALSTTACVINVAPDPTSQTGTPTTASQVLGKAIVTGTLRGPEGVISAGSGNVISAGSGNVVSAGALNRRVLALAENPLANSEVFVADAAGNPVPSIAPVKTDAQGRFTLNGLPADRTFMLAARVNTAAGKPALFKTLVRTSDLGATADINAPSTMVTTAVTQQDGSLGKFNPAKFKSALDATANNLTPSDLPDFADTSAVLAKMNELAAEIAEIKTALDEIRQELAEIKSDIKDIKAMLAGQKPTGGAPTTTPGTDPGTAPTGQVGYSEDECAFAFGYIDVDYNAVLTAQEFGLLFENGAEAAQTFLAVDTNQDGYVTVDEFVPPCSASASEGSGDDYEEYEEEYDEELAEEEF